MAQMLLFLIFRLSSLCSPVCSAGNSLPMEYALESQARLDTSVLLAGVFRTSWHAAKLILSARPNGWEVWELFLVKGSKLLQVKELRQLLAVYPNCVNCADLLGGFAYGFRAPYQSLRVSFMSAYLHSVVGNEQIVQSKSALRDEF